MINTAFTNVPMQSSTSHYPPPDCSWNRARHTRPPRHSFYRKKDRENQIKDIVLRALQSYFSNQTSLTILQHDSPHVYKHHNSDERSTQKYQVEATPQRQLRNRRILTPVEIYFNAVTWQPIRKVQANLFAQISNTQELRTLLFNLPNTTTIINLSGRNISHYVSDLTLCFIAHHFSNLRSLNLQNCFQITDNGLTELLQVNPTLTSLILGQKPLNHHPQDLRLTISSAQAIALCSSLEILSLQNCACATDEWIELIGSKCSKLRMLDLSGTTQMTDRGYDAVLRHWPNLEHFDFNTPSTSLISTATYERFDGTLLSLNRLLGSSLAPSRYN